VIAVDGKTVAVPAKAKADDKQKDDR
jgi:hypothetical protein